MANTSGALTLVGHSGVGVDIGGSFAKLVYFRCVPFLSYFDLLRSSVSSCGLDAHSVVDEYREETF